MSENKGTMLEMTYTKPQLYLLLALRIIIGYHFLYEGMNKLFTHGWSSAPFLMQSNWIFSDLFVSLANSPTLLIISDILNIWGQLFIGVGLILGLFSKYAALAGAFLLFLYYITYPPFMQNALFIDSNLIELLCLLIIAFFQTNQIIGLDGLLDRLRSKPKK